VRAGAAEEGAHLVKELFRDYGSAIGPTLAFLLGVLAVTLHFYVNAHLERAETLHKFDQLKQLISQSTPPPEYFSERLPQGTQGRNLAAAIDNARNLAIFHNRLDTTKVLIDNLQERIYRHCELEDIKQFNSIKSRHETLVAWIEEMQGRTIAHKYDIDGYNSLVETYARLKKAAEHPAELFRYVGSTVETGQ